MLRHGQTLKTQSSVTDQTHKGYILQDSIYVNSLEEVNPFL